MPTGVQAARRPHDDAQAVRGRRRFRLDGELTIENGTDRIALYGSVDLTRDKQGLARARALAALLGEAIRLLEADTSLPDAVPPPVAPGTVKNPFE